MIAPPNAAIGIIHEPRIGHTAVGAKLATAAPANAWLNGRPPYADKSGNPASCWNRAL